MSFAWRIYRRLAQAFPHEFKLAYGSDVMQLGQDVFEEIARRRGAAGLMRLIADIAVRVPIEYLSEMRRDMRYAIRALLRSPGFTLVGILSMGIGMGLTTVVYSSEFSLITRDLPAVTNAKELVMQEKPVSYYFVEQYRAQRELFAGVAAFQTGVPFNVTFPGNAKPQRVFGQLVSPDYFSVLGVQAQRGRLLSAELDKPGDAPVVVISDRFWRNHLDSSPDAVGQTLRLNGQLATIVGITPMKFNGAMAIVPAELFVPVTVPAALAPELANGVLHQHDAKQFLALARLAPGVTTAAAESGLGVITHRLEEQDASAPRNAKATSVSLLAGGTMAPIPKDFRNAAIAFFLALMGLIMAIACMNLANMLLARGANRRKELAIRLAVGASRFRLVRQMMSEGILLSLLGGIAGFALGYGLSVLNSRFTLPTAVPEESDFIPDWTAALFVFGLAIVCGIGFSLVPALRATKADLTPALKEGSALQVPGYRRIGLRNVLMVAQVAGSLMLLLVTGFLVVGIVRASKIQTKFDAHTMSLFSIDPIRDGYSADKAQALFDKLPEQLKRASPGSTIVFSAQTPFSIGSLDTQMTAENSEGTARVQHSVAKQMIGPGFFAGLSEPLLTGREFVDSDQRSQGDGSHPLPLVLNERAARGFFGNGEAIGKRLRDNKQSYEVVGIVRNMKSGLGLSQPVVYSPLTRSDFGRPPAGGIIVLVRSEMGSDSLSAIRSELTSIDPNLIIFNTQTLSEFLELTRSYDLYHLDTYGGIGIFGLVLAAIGLAGVTAYAVAQRRKEIGIRTALGATKIQVLGLVLREGTALIGVGTVLGFLGAFALAKVAATITNALVEGLQIGTGDPRLLVGAPMLLAAVAMLACYIPARRAAKIDPLQALRQE